MKTSIGEALHLAQSCLEAAGITEALAAAEVLLADLLSVPRAHLYLESRRPLSALQHESYAARIARRQRGEPVQYITGRQEFWSLEFEINPCVLIPRLESELVVEHGVRLVRQWGLASPQDSLCILDVGTGSGNLAISLARELPQSRLWGIDRALGALQVARRNAQRLGVADRLRWVCGDLLTPLQGGPRRFALCVSNLPYVTTAEWAHLPREIREYEPPEALLGGDDGLDLIRRVITASPEVLVAGGVLLLEVGWKQAPAVTELMRQGGCFRRIGVERDFADIERVVWAQVA